MRSITDLYDEWSDGNAIHVVNDWNIWSGHSNRVLWNSEIEGSRISTKLSTVWWELSFCSAYTVYSAYSFWFKYYRHYQYYSYLNNYFMF